MERLFMGEAYRLTGYGIYRSGFAFEQPLNVVVLASPASRIFKRLQYIQLPKTQFPHT
ncbi:MAG: hypothetical protein LBL39_06405 [Planctomycetaceae bacterium]|nr:hypothetical protein [Planctomycetaceae bacterium]